jgi:hypothetical protein
MDVNMYLAKPYNQNFLKSQMFATTQECANFLNEFSKNEIIGKVKVDEWAILGKIMTVNVDGTFSRIDVDTTSFL